MGSPQTTKDRVLSSKSSSSKLSSSWELLLWAFPRHWLSRPQTSTESTGFINTTELPYSPRQLIGAKGYSSYKSRGKSKSQEANGSVLMVSVHINSGSGGSGSYKFRFVRFDI